MKGEMQMNLAGMEAAVYLRKSRMEEGQSTEAVLARHRAALIQYAQVDYSTGERC